MPEVRQEPLGIEDAKKKKMRSAVNYKNTINADVAALAAIDAEIATLNADITNISDAVEEQRVANNATIAGIKTKLTARRNALAGGITNKRNLINAMLNDVNTDADNTYTVDEKADYLAIKTQANA